MVDFFARRACVLSPIRVTMSRMAKKTGMSDSSLWVITVLLLALSAWMYLKK